MKIGSYCKGSWVCFHCRTVARRPTHRGITFWAPTLLGARVVDGVSVRCSRCRELARFLGPTFPVPPLRDDRAWKKLEEEIDFRAIAARDAGDVELVQKRHQLERRIIELESRPDNKDVKALLKRLREDLAAGRFDRWRY